MKKIFLSLSLLAAVLLQSVNAQMSVGTSAAPNANAVLDLVSSNQGLLLPRVALTSTTAYAPLSAWVAGMQVYNTATTSDVTPGVYYCDGSKWVRNNVGSISKWRLSSPSFTFTSAETQLTGTSTLTQNELGLTAGTNSVTVPSGRYLIILNGDNGLWEMGEMRVKNNTTTLIDIMYLGIMQGASCIVDFTSQATITLTYLERSDYLSSTKFTATPPYSTGFWYELTFLKLK